MKTRVAMMFGGKSVEHEVAVISGIQAIMNMDTDKYEVIPVYMTKKNEMYVGDDIGNIDAYKNIPELLNKSQRVILVNLVRIRNSRLILLSRLFMARMLKMEHFRGILRQSVYLLLDVMSPRLRLEWISLL